MGVLEAGGGEPAELCSAASRAPANLDASPRCGHLDNVAVERAGLSGVLAAHLIKLSHSFARPPRSAAESVQALSA